MPKDGPFLVESHRPRQTIGQKVSHSGVGVHTGKVGEIHFIPAKSGTGIRFRRLDLEGQPETPALAEFVVDTARHTVIQKDEARVATIEHVLAAVKAFEIDDLLIEVSCGEPPVGDGGSNIFVSMLERALVVPCEEGETTPIYGLKRPFYHTDNGVSLVALPSSEYRVTYVLNYPNAKGLGQQVYSAALTRERFKEEMAPCRTFALYEELKQLVQYDLIQGGSLDNAVIVKDDLVFSKEGIRFPNEMARHKALDLVGDLSLVGVPFFAHIIAVCSGHTGNCALAKMLREALSEVE